MSDHAKTESEQFEKLHELIDGMHTAMLTTAEGTRMRSRPMAVIKNEGNVLWFFTGKDSDKAREIGGHSQVNVAFADESHNKFVSISGKAQVIDDCAKAKELWTVFAKGWFDGPEDPDLRMIRFEMDSAEYWDAPSSKMVYLFNLLRSAVTGSEVGMGENEEVDVKSGNR